MKKHYLFICTSNLDRSPCAANLFEDSEEVEARSAGFFPASEESNPITREAIKWASVIFVMDERNEFHKTQLLQKFPEAEEKEIITLGIPNDLARNDPELEKLLKVRLEKLGFLEGEKEKKFSKRKN